MSKVWTFQIVDFGRVPDAFKTLNEVAVRAHMRAALALHPDETPVLPGLIFEQVEQVSAVKS